MSKRTLTGAEWQAYEAAKARGALGKEVVFGSRPATEAQMSAIRSMLRRAGYRHESEAIKAAIGKVPVQGLNRERASQVIEHLRARIERER